MHCSKLRVYPAPCVHILAAGCIITDFETCAPGVCMLLKFPQFIQVCIVSRKKWPGASFWGSLHPTGAHNKTLISNTGISFHMKNTL